MIDGHPSLGVFSSQVLVLAMGPDYLQPSPSHPVRHPTIPRSKFRRSTAGVFFAREGGGTSMFHSLCLSWYSVLTNSLELAQPAGGCLPRLCV